MTQHPFCKVRSAALTSQRLHRLFSSRTGSAAYSRLAASTERSASAGIRNGAAVRGWSDAPTWAHWHWGHTRTAPHRHTRGGDYAPAALTCSTAPAKNTVQSDIHVQPGFRRPYTNAPNRGRP
ncbi:hypothetical protein EYF80_048230 [Liparis tanakae]|uniref:Uncharacterized protein n=1 Tax=Liparis tanakae TaxID=230148 RepID=A0A4Z2FL30_9TELE|nr:hypothetical protein EYF80_048230 [Liparis tanakae]